MLNLKTMLAAFLLAGTATQTALAQTESTKKKADYPYVFVGVQGGGQVTFTNYKASKLITPIGAVSVGGMFTPVVGARLHVSGINEKGGLKSQNKTYDYKFVTSNVDLMFNLCNASAPNKHHAVNAYLIGGVGLGYAWDNDDMNGLAPSAAEKNLNLRWDDDRLVHNFRVGMQLDYEVTPLVGINLEVTANNLHDRFNSKLNGHGDWQVQALLGVNFKFGRSKAASTPVVLPAPEPARPVVDEPKPEPAPEVKPEPKPETPAPKQLAETKAEIFFTIGSSAVRTSEEAKVKEFAQWMKDHPTAKAEIMGYADAGTGNAEINRNISEKRAARVAKLLTEKYGIPASRLTSGYKGDTVQPYSDNDSNRVVIGVAKEQ